MFVGAGFNAFGIAAGGGAGMVLAEWVAKGEPPYDLWPVDIRRFGSNHLDTSWVRTRTLEAYAKHYTMAWPFEEYRSGRPLRRSPLYARLKAEGACFGEKLGWERPNWFADLASGEKAEDHLQLRAAELVRLPSAASTRQPASASPCSTRRPSPSSSWSAAMREQALSWICRQRRGEAAGPSRLHADAERARRHRVRPDGRQAIADRILHRHRHRLRHARFRLDLALDSRWARCPPDRCHLCICRAVGHGAAVARRAPGPDRARPFQCRLPVRQGEADDARRRAGARAPRHLCRRARLGAAYSRRVCREPFTMR